MSSIKSFWKLEARSKRMLEMVKKNFIWVYAIEKIIELINIFYILWIKMVLKLNWISYNKKLNNYKKKIKNLDNYYNWIKK